MLEQLFRLRDNKTTVRTEIVAGLTTFMTMAYILAVNPYFLGFAGMPRGGVLVATALAAFIGTLFMAFFANYPFVLAAGMGLNAYFAFTVCGDMGYSWPFALLAVFVEGLVFLALSVTPVRESIFNAIPFSLKKAVAAGIGLFITLIALKSAGILVPDQATYIKLVSFHDAPIHTAGIVAILALVGTVLTAVLYTLKFKAAILLGILGTWLLGILAEVTGLYTPDATTFYSTIPHFATGPDGFSIAAYFNAVGDTFREFGTTFGAVFDPSAWTHTAKDGAVTAGWDLAFSLNFFVVMFAFFFVDLFDTLGTLIGVSMKGGFLTKEGKLPRISGALCADAIATSVGAVFGTSTTTTYVESASGVAAGGKTGLTAVTSAALFALAILFAPIFLAVPGFATAPALIIVGYLMLSSCADIDWRDAGEAVPAFLTIVAMPFTYSISEGIMFGVISYTVINALAGKFSRIHWIMYILTALFIAKYAMM